MSDLRVDTSPLIKSNAFIVEKIDVKQLYWHLKVQNLISKSVNSESVSWYNCYVTRCIHTFQQMWRYWIWCPFIKTLEFSRWGGTSWKFLLTTDADKELSPVSHFCLFSWIPDLWFLTWGMCVSTFAEVKRATKALFQFTLV